MATSALYSSHAFAAAPDSNGKIVYQDTTAGDDGITQINPDGSGKSTVHPLPGSYINSFPLFANNTYSFFIDQHDGSIHKLNLDTGSATMVASAGFYGAATVSPDGGAIIGFLSANNCLALLDFSTGDIYCMVGGWASYPKWSPDSTKIAYTQNGDIFMIDLTDGSTTQVTNYASSGSYSYAYSFAVNWSPDGSELALNTSQNSDMNNLYFYDVSTHSLTPFDASNSLPASSSIASAAYSPDGTRLAYILIDGNTGTKQLVVASGFTSDAPKVVIDSSVYANAFTIEWRAVLSSLPVYRFWSAKNQHHFFTSNYDEAFYVMTSYPTEIWDYEGIAFSVSNNATCAGDEIPVYRFWSDKLTGHFFTANGAEKDHIISHYPTNVWRYEGQAFCSVSSSASGAQPVYRFWSDLIQSHFYTADPAEKDYILSHYPTSTWRYEGIGYYAL